MILRFDCYELDDALFELRKGGRVCPLPRKGFDLLRYLLESAPRVVTKDELFAEIWPGEHVGDSVLPVSIRTVRKALGERESERVLKTVRGRGYRVVCAVERCDARAPAVPPVGAQGSFVGRESLMARLQATYAEAVSGAGRAVLLYGESGIGKTRTLDEFARWCRASGALVLQVRCPDDPGAPPFWPVFELLRAGGALLSSPELRARTERSGFDLVRARESVLEFAQQDLTQRMDADAARFGLIQVVVRLLDRTSRIAPVVVLMDDLHCIDEGTARLCEAVVRSIPGKRVMSLSAYRDSELRRGTILAQIMGSISSSQSLQQLRLRGLDRHGIARFVGVELGTEPSPALVDALWERTEGNPFFLREMLRLLASEADVEAEGAAALARLGLAQGIKDTVGRRLDKLSGEANDVLRWASVIGRRFSFPVLLQLCDLASTRLLELLGEAEEAHLIVSASAQAGASELLLGEFSFAHALVRETIYEDLTGPERVLRHRAVAESIERVRGEDRRAYIFELAKHFFEAAPGGDIDRAVDYAVRAARLAQQQYANDDAVLHFDQALRAEGLRVPRDTLRYCCLVLARGDALWRAGRYPQAQRELLRGADLARDLSRFDLLGYAVLGMVGWPRFNQLSFDAESPRIERGDVCMLAREALAGLGDANPSLCARLLAVRVRAGDGGSHEADLALAEEALRLARSSRDERALFHALLSKLSSLLLPENLDEGLALASEALDLAKGIGGRTRVLAACEARIPLLLMIGDMASADADIATAVEIADRHRSAAHRYATRRFELARALGEGDAGRAKELTSHVLELGRQVFDGGARFATDQISVWIIAAGGNVDAVHLALEPVDARLRENAEGAALAAYFYMLANDVPKCRSFFERLVASDFTGLRRDGSWLWHLCACADVAAYLGDEKPARRLYDLISPFAHVNVMNRLYCYRGAAAGPLARLAHLMGRHAEAVELLEAAVAFNRRIRAEPSRVWTECVLASVLAQGSHAERDRAEELFASVERDAAAVGLAPLVDRFRALS